MLETLIARIASGPVLVSGEQRAVFEANIQAVIRHEKAAEMAAEIEARTDDEEDDFWPPEDDWRASLRPYKVKNGVLMIPVMGVLLHRFPYALGSWATGYEYIRRAFKRGQDDDNVRGFALIEDSPGGMVAGCFELVEELSAPGRKPMRAYASDHAYSAAYAIASAADQISVTRSGGVGSVGVVTSHIDYSGYLKDAGIKITFIYAGDQKVEGNPYEPLSADAKKRIQARIDKLYGVFVSTVAENRDMDEKDVRATEAGCFDAEDALAVGFADKIESPEDGLEDFWATFEREDDTMAGTQGQDTGKKPENSGGGDEAAVNAARAEGEQAGKAAGAKAERERIAAILTCPNAAGREAAAIEMALDEETSFSASTANKQLARLPKTADAASTDGEGDKGKTKATGEHFNAAMDASGNPEVGTGGNKDSGKTDENAKNDSATSGTYKDTMSGGVDEGVLARVRKNAGFAEKQGAGK